MIVITMTNDPVTDSGAPSGAEVPNRYQSVVRYSGGPILVGPDVWILTVLPSYRLDPILDVSGKSANSAKHATGVFN
jgi:hypothetical protein